MKLKETLAEKANKVQQEEEIKATIEDAGMELSEDELDEVSGGKNYDIKVMILWMEDLNAGLNTESAVDKTFTYQSV